MRTISPSKFSVSGGCCKFLDLLCDKKGGKFSNKHGKRDSRQNQDSGQRAGDIVHEIVQYALDGDDKNQRNERIGKIIEIISEIKSKFDIKDYLDEIIGEKKHLKGVMHDQTISKIVEETIPLINSANKLLRYLEKKIPDSENKWLVTSEENTKGINNVKIKIMQEEMTSYGKIDLVFQYKNNVIIGELKTGTPEEYKIKKWRLQTQLMRKSWEIKHQNDKILATFIINSELPNGRLIVNGTNAIDNIENQNRDDVFPGYHCRNCPEKYICNSAEI
ncbi:hypothetical protein N8809_02200 [Euryarchaeota archaeon]|nr:hypothetical protein [Euryarchaeota archaeon]|tara:strand:- start:112 stop:939 length:828 start_codon:yes stop_codon:yes gene_type:complete